MIPLLGQAQSTGSDSVRRLDEVVITQTRLHHYAVGHYTVRPDTHMLRLASPSTAAELFRKFGFGHIRSYGVGGVTTPSFRGTGGGHTAVLWNGINITSPLNGQSDLSLIPIGLADDVQFQSGGSATLYGSGAIGGTIQVNNTTRFNEGFTTSIDLSAGSFQTYFGNLSASFSGKRFVSSTRLFRSSSENNFPFTNRNSSTPTRENRQHNAFTQRGVLQENYVQLGKHQLISVRIWFQDNDVEVPNPSSVALASQATQRDQFVRSVVAWSLEYPRGHVFAQSAHVYHTLRFRDPRISLDSRSSFNTFINTIENSLSIGEKYEWTSGVNYTAESASGLEIAGDPQRQRIALYSAIKREAKAFTPVFSVRQEIANGRLTPISPSIGIDARLTDALTLFGSVSRNYRIPTFNDLYWRGAGARGNPDLKSESSWSEETGLRYESKLLKTWRMKGKFALFSNHVDDWIQWIPTGGTWTPENIRKVWSRGLESSLTIQQTAGVVGMEMGGRYSFTLATNEGVYDAARQAEVGKRLPYTPVHEAGATLKTTWKKHTFYIVHNFTGQQYTDDSNSGYLSMKPYSITNLWLSTDVLLRSLYATASFEINNLFNQEVVARPGYPLPGINFRAILSLRINQSNKQ